MTLRIYERAASSTPAALHVDSFVSERLSVVYCCVPKAMSRSILALLGRVDPTGFRLVGQVRPADVFERAGVSELPRFTFVRNPYSRAVAVYQDKFVNYRGTKAQQAIFGRYERLTPEMTFPEYVAWLGSSEGDDTRADPHFLSQHYFLLDRNGDAAVDYVGTVEDADEDFATLQSVLRIPGEGLPRINANKARRRAAFDSSLRWREMLDERSIRTLSARYDADFELLEYPRLSFRVVPRFPEEGHDAKGSSGVAPLRPLLKRCHKVLNRLLARVGLEVRRTQRSRGSRRPA